MNDSFEVVVLGGGPCGLAAATALAMHGRKVAIFERNRFGGPRVGETFGPEIVTSLRELGILDEFTNLEKIPFRGVQSAWGAESLLARPSIVHPLGEGFHVDRAVFDALLVRHAARNRVALHEDMGVATIAAMNDQWQLNWPNGRQVAARFLLDASGRGAPAGTRGFPERHWVACDRAVGIVTRLAPPTGREFAPELVLETAELGWWYVALQPGPILLCVLITDADLIGAHHRHTLPSRWANALQETRHVRALCADAKPIDGPRVVRADTGFLWPNQGSSWRAVGDAAFASDPLSGDGLVRGLSDAINAAHDVHALLSGDRPMNHSLAKKLDDKIPAYLDRRHKYYRIEKRWPDALFWRRRHGLDWPSTPITLDPRVLLRASSQDIDVHIVAPIEGLLPPRVLRAAVERCRQSTPAHEVLHHVRTAAPLGDRRLLIALQELVSRGVLVTDRQTLQNQS